MLHRQLLHSLTLLLVFVLGGVLADTYTKPQFCVQACYQTIASLSFRDYDKNQTYVGMRCHSRLAVSSIYACYNLRCASQFSFDESFGGLTHYCEEYGYPALNGTYDEVIQDLITEYGSVENVPVIHPKTMKAVVNTTVLSDQEFYDLSYKTLVRSVNVSVIRLLTFISGRMAARRAYASRLRLEHVLYGCGHRIPRYRQPSRGVHSSPLFRQPSPPHRRRAILWRYR